VEDDRRPVFVGCPAVAPGGDCEEDVAEFPAFVREEVVVADGLVGVGAAFDDAVVEKMVEPLGEDLAGDAEVALEIVEAADPDEEVSEDERCPGLAGDVERAGDGAGHLAEGGSLHPPIVTKVALGNSVGVS